MDSKKIINLKSFGAIGDGQNDDTKAIQDAFDSGYSRIIIPYGVYKTTKTLMLSSNVEVIAHPMAVIYSAGEEPKYRGDFLLTNKDINNGNSNISICGGIWSGNNKAKYNKKGELFDVNGCSGATFNFINVKNLKLENLRIKDSVAFNIRMSMIENFHISNVEFYSEDLKPNQDGIHIGGFVKNGIIENISAISSGQTNDDLIALNADDCVERVDNFDLKRGPIENIVIRNIYAEDCHTFLRMLSVDAPIRNINISDVKCGCRVNAINMDGARYALTPLFKEDERPNGVGAVENITINNMTVHKSSSLNNKPLLQIEENAKNFNIKNFKRDFDKDVARNVSTFEIKNVAQTEVIFEQVNENELEKISEHIERLEKYLDVNETERINAVLKVNKNSDSFVYGGTFKNLLII